jgi:hypothetical protein
MWFIALLGLGAAFFAGVAAATERETRRQIAGPREPRELKPVKVVGPSPEEKKAVALKARLQSLRAQYAAFTHYNDPKWLTKHAKNRMQWLLDNRDEIMADCQQLHATRLDPAYPEDMSYVYEHDQELYERIMWQARVLAIAERLSSDEEVEETKSMQQQAAPHTELSTRIVELCLAYRDFEHYEQEEWIVEYASNPEHQRTLLAERTEILAADKDFHQDKAFIDALKACAPGIYRRATWRVKALAIADKLSAKPCRPSPEEREAKIIRFRERMLNRLQVKAEDQIALKLQRYLMIQKLKEAGAALGLDEDELDPLEQELRGDLNDEDEDSNGYRQL